MNFVEHQRSAQRRTRALIVLFGAAVLCICGAVYFVLRWAFVPPVTALGQSNHPFDPIFFLQVAAVTLCIIGAGSAYKIFQLAGGGAKVATNLGGRRVLPNTSDAAERRLINVVEEMAIASGVRVPDVYLLDNEESINAFAAGYSSRDAVIGLTRGAIDQLTRDELQGVVAHEFSHILFGDMRLNIRLMGVLHGILLLAILGRLLLSLQQRPLRRSNKEKGIIPIFIIGIGLLIVGGIGVFFSRLIKSAASRQREFLADASSVQFTRQPIGLANALRKIGGLPQGSRIAHPRAEEASHLFFGDYLQRHWFSLLATHPPLNERIARIESLPIAAGTHVQQSALETQTVGISLFDGQSSSKAIREVLDRAEPVSPARLAYARLLLQSLPSALITSVHEPISAYAILCLLLLSDDQSQRIAQIDYLYGRVSTVIQRECIRLEPQVRPLVSSQRLALADLTLPALRGLSKTQYEEFRDTVVTLTGIDAHCSFFEYAMQWAIVRALDSHFGGRAKVAVVHYRLEAVATHLKILLSFVARAGNADQQLALEAYRKALRSVAMNADGMVAPSLGELDIALQSLEHGSPEVKQRVVEALLVCVAEDGVLRGNEIELVRAACDALDYPLPPLIASSKLPQP